MEQLIEYGQLGLSKYALAIKNGRLNLILPPPLYTPSINGKHTRDFLLVITHNINNGAKV